MVLMESGTSDWRITNRSVNRGEILAASSRIDDAGAAVTEYARYYHVNGQWNRVVRSAEGLWQNDSTFPPLSFFP